MNRAARGLVFLTATTLFACGDGASVGPSNQSLSSVKPGVAATPAPVPEPVIGTITLNAKKLVLRDSIAVWSRDGELHIYCYPFVLTPAHRQSIQKFEAEALSLINDASLNPDPERWATVPVIAFHYVYEDLEKDQSMEGVRHSRFVSWLRKYPTTLNFRASEACKHTDALTLEDSHVTFRSAGTEEFGDMKFTWDISTRSDLVTTEK